MNHYLKISNQKNKNGWILWIRCIVVRFRRLFQVLPSRQHHYLGFSGFNMDRYVGFLHSATNENRQTQNKLRNQSIIHRAYIRGTFSSKFEHFFASQSDIYWNATSSIEWRYCQVTHIS